MLWVRCLLCFFLFSGCVGSLRLGKVGRGAFVKNGWIADCRRFGEEMDPG